MRMGRVASEPKIINLRTIRPPHHELELSHIPEHRSVVQAGKDVFCTRSRVAVLQPAQLNGPPQLVTESKPLRPLRFYRSDPLYDRIDS